jgi:hypothetical protein
MQRGAPGTGLPACVEASPERLPRSICGPLEDRWRPTGRPSGPRLLMGPPRNAAAPRRFNLHSFVARVKPRTSLGEKGTGQMKVMVIVKATHESENELSPGDEKLLREMTAYNEELVKAGIMLAGEGLRPSKHGKRVRFSSAQRKVLDGPFAETKELVAGFWLWQVKSMEEAIDWVKRCPNPMPGSSEAEIEIRPLYEVEDLAAADPTGEIRKKERELRDEIETHRG